LLIYKKDCIFAAGNQLKAFYIMKKILLFMFLAMPLAGLAQKSYVQIVLGDGLKISESNNFGSTLYLTGDIPTGIKDYYYTGYSSDDMTMGKLMNLLSKEGFVLEKAFGTGTDDHEIVIMSKSEPASLSKIQSIEVGNENPYEVARYNLQGIPVKETEKGVQIIVFSNFTTKTVVVE